MRRPIRAAIGSACSRRGIALDTRFIRDETSSSRMNLEVSHDRRSGEAPAPPAKEPRAEGSGGAPKYGSASFIDAMRQSALGKWMRYLGSASEIEEAFG